MFIFLGQLTTSRVHWQPYPVDSYFAICDDHTIHTCVTSVVQDTRIPGTEVVEANSLYRVSFFYLFLARALCYCSLFVLFCFHALVGAFSVDVPKIFSCPTDDVLVLLPDWQPRILLGRSPR